MPMIKEVQILKTCQVLVKNSLSESRVYAEVMGCGFSLKYRFVYSNKPRNPIAQNPVNKAMVGPCDMATFLSISICCSGKCIFS